MNPNSTPIQTLRNARCAFRLVASFLVLAQGNTGGIRGTYPLRVVIRLWCSSLLSTLFESKTGATDSGSESEFFNLQSNFLRAAVVNCYTIAIRSVEKALTHVAEGRQVKKRELGRLWETRTEAAAQELGFNYASLRHNLTKCSIALDRRILSDLAYYRDHDTFKSLVLTYFARAKRHQEPPNEKAALEAPPEGVFTRGML
uniref:Putative ribosomal protein l20 n=1 Tax=Ixodes ricinus TaxID=34613 RepID=V5H7E8_IXORI